MSQIIINSGASSASTTRYNRYLIAFGLVLVLLAGLWAYRLWTTQKTVATRAVERSTATTISVKTLEERYGIRLHLLAVTAAGGMVDFRYIITDKEKAAPLFDSLGNVTLIAQDDGTKLTMATGHGMRHNAKLENGALNFHFFANAHNAIKPGRPVTVVIGPVTLEPINAQ